MNIIFLDIDGVLNGHEYDEMSQSPIINHHCVFTLNRILDNCDAKICIISSWRYQIIKGATTIKGFEYMLRSHGVHCVDRVIGFTQEDEIHSECADDMVRDIEIAVWLALAGFKKQTDKFVIIDDAKGRYFLENRVQPQGAIGLQMTDAIKALRILGIEHDPWKHTFTTINHDVKQ